MTLTEVLKYLYEQEQNVEISSFWDAGWTFRLGDRANGFIAESITVYDLQHGADWLMQAYRDHQALRRL